MNRFALYALTLLILTTLVAQPTSAQTVQSPEDFFGHRVGEDYTLIHWEKIVEYFQHLGENSDRINLRELGTTTEGRPFLFAEMSDAGTIANLDPHRAAQRKLADPRTIRDDAEEQHLIRDSKVTLLINCQLHSNETAGSQMAIELAYALVTDESPEMQEIRDRVIVLLIPCANPDGQKMVAEWYERSLGEPWEGTGLPWLYQKYAGHDNNRDWFMLNLKETRLTTEVIYKEWAPTIVWDVHQMGNRTARLFVPPFHDPKNQNVHPIIDQTLLIIGGHMAGDLAKEGKQGVVHGAIYDNWWAGGFRTTPYRHNMIGILTEAASVNLASPIFQRKDELRGARRGLPQYQAQTNFPDPWPGGWWRLRDIVDYELTAAKSLFTLAARYHDRFQEDYVHFGREAVARGQNEPPYAWLVPPDQRDPRSAYEMLERLEATAVEVHRADEAFTADGVEYPEGTFIMYCAQPYRPHLMDMMERQVYPNRVMYPGGPAESPYDMAGWTMPLQMGVRHVAVAASFEVAHTKLDAIPFPQGNGQENSTASHVLIPAGNIDTYRVANRLHSEGIDFSVYRGQPVTVEGETVVAGSLVIEADRNFREKRGELFDTISSSVISLSSLPDSIKVQLADAPHPRTALYQPWTASMDEGWTRLILENHEFEYMSIHNAEIRSGNLADRYDCIVLPSLSVNGIINGQSPDTTAPEFVGGIGDEGVVALQDFVQAGGTLVCIDGSTNLPIERFNIPVRNVVEGKPTEEFFCPGSVLRLSMDTNHPLGFGMPEWYSGYFARSQAFEIVEPEDEEDANDRDPGSRFPTTVVSRFSDTVLLESGWIRGGDLIADKPAIVKVTYGKGTIHLLGIGVQRRGQPHGTFPILFNAIQASTL